MEIKIEPNRLASLSKRMMEHQNRTKNLQHSLEREAGKMTSLLWQSEFPPPFTGQITGQNDMINQTSQRIVNTLEYQSAWLSYFAHKASGADGAPFSLKQAEAVLAKYDDRFRKPEKSEGLDKGTLAKDAAGELSGVYDVQRAATGIDPVTGEKISGWSRALAGGMFVLGVTPIGKGIKAVKVARTADKMIDLAQEGQKVKQVVESANVVKGKGSPLLLGEGKVGTYEDLIDAGTRGDNLTPHHMPSAKYMKTNAGVHKNDGISMNMEHPHPGKGGRHRLTETYGMTGKNLDKYLNLEPRNALARDIADARSIYLKQGKYNPEIRSGLLEVINLNKSKFPNLYDR